MPKVFLDTSYALALAFNSDVSHIKATQIASWLDQENISILTTRAVVLEIGNALSKYRYRYQAVDLLEAMEAEEKVEIISLSDELYWQALALFKSRADKEWGLVDCVSCVAMRANGLVDVLTADRHFQQMGFRALLCET